MLIEAEQPRRFRHETRVNGASPGVEQHHQRADECHGLTPPDLRRECMHVPTLCPGRQRSPAGTVRAQLMPRASLVAQVPVDDGRFQREAGPDTTPRLLPAAIGAVSEHRLTYCHRPDLHRETDRGRACAD